uniref:Putative cohesin subunit n=2 Tax=Davidia involucrata TaxID=16924 RepID=A0A5B7B3K6_DAVIN
MFYSQFILAKKGPLGTIWIAAHLERKLRKNQVADTDIGVSVDSILFPEVPIALRLSSHLLLGVVRIYSRKVNYLFDDCSEALLKIKQAFRSTAVDLPPEESTAPYHSITLPETFDLDDFELPDNDIFQGNYVDHHVSTRDQITLQDTMEGVVYSTSQFGLDERFGDGDTSGLDLDEELFLDKVAAPGHAGVMLGSDSDPQASGHPMTLLKQDENHEGMAENSEDMLATASANQFEGPTQNTNFIEYAHAPCTPGLVEEPNLSNIQEASACDDHLESEDHNLTEFAAKENLENATSKSDLHYGSTNSVDQSLLNDMNPETVVPTLAEENGYLLDAQEIKQLKPLGGSPSTAGTMEHISLENPHSVSLPSSHMANPDKTISPISEFSDRIIAASDGANRVEELRNGVVSNNEPDIHFIDGAHADSVESQGVRLDETEASPVVSHDGPILEDPYGNVEKSCPLGNAVALNTESPGRPDLENPETQASQLPKDSNILNPDVHEEMALTHMHVLQPCNSHLNQPNTLNSGGDNSVATDLPSEVVGLCSLETSGRERGTHASEASTEVQGEGCHTTDVTKPALDENHVTELASCEDIQEDFSRLGDQVSNVISGDTQLENLHSSDNSELPAPEKLLSVPEGLADLPNNLLVESTPDKAILGGVDGGGAGIQIISGKKRSYTESTLTVQSLDSIESLEAAKRTRESIPDDDDLLSSILVGRKSSVLKVKPTPPLPPEITTMRRPRSATRVSASKRKVLMDDSMVLHGDTIRQQLTSTEDIRRVRKKAPCTRPEIWMIQKQFLEDEIFSEPIFTGLSTELVSLHNQKYDLSDIRVSQNDENISSLGAAHDMEFAVGPNVTKETGMVGSTEPAVVRNDGEAEVAKTFVQTENQLGEEHALSSQGYDSQVQMKAISDVLEPKSSEHEPLGEISGMEIDGGSVSVADALNPDIILGVDPSSSSYPVLGDTFNMSTGFVVQPASLDKDGSTDASLQMNVSGVSPDQKLDTQFVEMDASMVDITSGNGVDAVEVAEKNDDNVAVVGTESRAMDEFLLEETEIGASVEIGAEGQRDCSSPNKNSNPSLTTSPETGGCSNQVVVFADPALEEIQINKQGFVNEYEVLAAELDNDDKNLTSNGICSEESKLDSSYPVELIADVKNASLYDGEYPGNQEANPQSIMDADTAAIDYTATGDHVDFDYTIDGHDTGFLNVDDDDVAEENDDYMPSAEETHFLENSGWSSRTRAVAKYLQTLFDKEAEHGRKVLPMDNLLASKTRKEASRMFFEALVLKTKDYIHVEQGNPFDNINIKPRVKLMKSDF